MQTFLDFETRIAELQGKIAELKSIGEERRQGCVHRDEVKQLEVKLAKSLADLYCRPRSVAEDTGRPPPRPAAYARLYR
jgi:acetyl-CoA carboxylase carboxyl transferase subunit alpha